MNPLRRLRVDPHLLRRTAYAVAVLAALGSMFSSFVYEPETNSVWVVGWIPIIAVASVPNRRFRATILAVGGGFIALWTPDAVFLWPAVSAFVMVSVTEDLHEVPIVGWAFGFAGSIGGLFLYPDQATVSGFLAVALGGGLGLVLRSRFTEAELTEQAHSLRGKAAWLEQRTSLARELHDVVGHHVTAMVVQAEAGQMGDAQAALRNIGDLGRKALGELDALVVHLRDPKGELVVSAPPRLLDIDELLAAPLRGQGVEVSVRMDEELGLGEVGVLTVYRIAQEALTNVTRHAHAEHAWVELTRSDGRVRLRVSDDGVGPSPAPDRGAGLLGIEERVSALGGSWDMSSRPGGGTIIDVSIPVDSR
ncbi:MAG TPA: sensor histidine kinase [Nocardioides sp.]|nr:sensor histidine kinase [Nocardioides sp.]